MTFSLHPDLKRDCFEVAQLPLCEVLLRNDARFPWLILVPRRTGLKEWFDLAAGDLEQVNREVMHVAKTVGSELQADKINIAALGNITLQLHIHAIARFKGDAAWPNPVWNNGRAIAYTDAQKAALIKRLANITNL